MHKISDRRQCQVNKIENWGRERESAKNRDQTLNTIHEYRRAFCTTSHNLFYIQCRCATFSSSSILCAFLFLFLFLFLALRLSLPLLLVRLSDFVFINTFDDEQYIRMFDKIEIFCMHNAGHPGESRQKLGTHTIFLAEFILLDLQPCSNFRLQFTFSTLSFSFSPSFLLSVCSHSQHSFQLHYLLAKYTFSAHSETVFFFFSSRTHILKPEVGIDCLCGSFRKHSQLPFLLCSVFYVQMQQRSVAFECWTCQKLYTLPCLYQSRSGYFKLKHCIHIRSSSWTPN